MITRTLGLSLIAFGLLAGCQKTPAPDAAATAAAVTPTAPASPPVSEEPAQAIPETAEAIWAAIDQHRAELKAAIDSGALDTVHHHAFAIRDLVAALPAHSPVLPAEAQAKLESEVKFVSTLADRLDQSGDAGDKAGTQANYDKLVAVLSGITRNK